MVWEDQRKRNSKASYKKIMPARSPTAHSEAYPAKYLGRMTAWREKKSPGRGLLP